MGNIIDIFIVIVMCQLELGAASSVIMTIVGGVSGVKIDAINKTDSLAVVDDEVRTPDSGYSSVSSHSSRSLFLGNVLDVHAEEFEPPGSEVTDAQIKPLEDQPAAAVVECKKKDRKRSKSEDDDKQVTKDVTVPGVSLRSLVPGASSDLVEKARVMVERAVKQHKVFIIFGQYSSVRRALKRRGWLEKPCDCCRVPR